MMNKFDYNLMFLLLSNIIALGIAVWKLSQWEERLQYQINQNKKDIDNGLNGLRTTLDNSIKGVKQEIKGRDYLIQVKLNTLTKYVQKISDYEPPTMDDYDS